MNMFRKYAAGAVTFFFAMVACAWLASQHTYAEGSKELIGTYPGGYRPFLSWSPDSLHANIGGTPNTTILYVYAEPGETLYLGSSVHNAYDNQDIVAIPPSGGTPLILDVQPGGIGLIDTLAKEQAGPFDSGGYTPLTISVDDVGEQAGWWTIQFHGAAGPGHTDPAPSTNNVQWGYQGSTVAAWDVTVSSDGATEEKGRMYTKYLALSTGSSAPAAEIYSEVYVLTLDGYQYRVNLNGINPFGFLMFANNRGFIDAGSNTSLFRSVLLNVMDDANISVHSPHLPDTEADSTYQIFFNLPSDDLPADFLVSPLAPSLSDASFEGESGTKALVGEGGEFEFTSGTLSTYELIIDVNKDGNYDPSDASPDIIIGSTAMIGSNQLLWNGRQSDGSAVPVGIYTAKLMLKGGEYHFPMLDVENANNGIMIEMLNAPQAFPTGMDEYTVYYNDSNYITGNGTSVNLNGAGAPIPRDASAGIDSSAGAHGFSNNYGDEKAIDMWTYFPGLEAIITLEIVNGPDAEAQTLTTDEVEPLNIVLLGTDAETSADDLTYTIVTDPSHGTLSGTGRNLTYTPDSGHNGLDSFTFTVTDEDGITSAAATVSITVNAVNEAPNATAQTLTTDEDEALNIVLSGTDAETLADDLTYTIVTDPSHGTLSGTGRNRTYTPDAGYAGPDSFTFTVTDTGDGAAAALTSAAATVSITVNAAPPSNPPGGIYVPVWTADITTFHAIPEVVILRTELQRMTDSKGLAFDKVEINGAQARTVVDQLNNRDDSAAKLVMPNRSSASISEVILTGEAATILSQSNKSFGIHTSGASLFVPQSTLTEFKENVRYAFIPIDQEQSKADIIHQAQLLLRERNVSRESIESLKLAGQPVAIETNAEGNSIRISLPLPEDWVQDVPSKKIEIDDLAVFIRYSDGDGEFVKGSSLHNEAAAETVVTFEAERLGTFSLMAWDGAAAYWTAADEFWNHDGEAVFELVQGYPDGTFRPDTPITRAEMAAFLSRYQAAFRSIADVSQSPVVWFPDVPESHWAYDYIATATAQGWMIGYPDKTYQPDKLITRAEAAMIAFRLEGLEANMNVFFQDTGGHWAAPAIESLRQDDIMRGYADRLFGPDQPLTRAQAITLLNRIFGIQPSIGRAERAWPDVPSSHWAYADIEAITTQETMQEAREKRNYEIERQPEMRFSGCRHLLVY